MLKRVLFDSFIYAILPKITLVFSLFLMPLTTQYLTGVDYGVYGVVMAYVGLLAGFRELGMGVNLTNVFYKHPDNFKIIWRNLIGFLYAWGVVYAIIFSILLYYIIPSEADENRFLVMVLMIVPTAIFGPINRIGTLYYQLQRRPLPVTIISVGSAVLGIILSVTFIVKFRLGYMSWIYSNAIVAVCSGLVYYYLFFYRKQFNPIFKFNRRVFKRYLSVGLPIVPHQYANYLLGASDRVVMDMLQLPSNEIGKYNFGYGFGNNAQSIAEGVNKGFRPYLLKILSSNKPDRLYTYRRLTFIILGGMLISSAIGSLWMKEVFYLLVDNSNMELLQMYPLAIVVTMSFNFGPMYQSVSTILSYHEKTNQLWKMSFVAGVLNVVSNLILIPIYGIQAAAFTTMGAMLYLGFRGIALKSFKDNCDVSFFALPWLIAIIGATVSVYLLCDIHYSYKIIITAVYVLIILFNLGRIKQYISELK